MVAFFDLISSEHNDQLENEFKTEGFYGSYNEFSLDSDYPFDEIEILSLREYSKITPLELDKLPKLKAIALRITGFDNVDLDESTKRGIVVMNVPEYGSHTVAEYAFTHILNLTRKFSFTLDNIAKVPLKRTDISGCDLFGKTLGIIGTGRIGSNSAKIGLGFGMKIIAYDVIENEELIKLGVTYLSLNEVLGQSDVISIHVPLLPTTKSLLNLGNIQMIKKGAFLVNTSRGEVVDNDALIQAMDQGILAGASIDVFKGERDLTLPLEKNKLPNITPESEYEKLIASGIIVTPHNSFNSIEANQRIIRTTIDNIRSFMQNAPINKVN